MDRKKPAKQRRQADDEARSEVQLGVKLLHTLEGHQARVRAVAFNQQGDILASGSDDRTIMLWEARSGKPIRTLAGHDGGVWSLAFGFQGETLACAATRPEVRMWQVASGKVLRTIKERDRVVCFDPSGHMLVTGKDGGVIQIWDARNGKPLRSLEGHLASVGSLGFDAEGTTLVSGSKDGTAKLWNPQSGELLHSLELEEHERNHLCSVAFSPISQEVACTNGLTITLWDRQSGRHLRTLEGHTREIEIIAFSPDGRLLASKSDDGTIRLWSSHTWETVSIIKVSRIVKEVFWNPALAFHPTLPLLATCASEPAKSNAKLYRLIQLWELDYNILLNKRAGRTLNARAVHHTTGKIVLVGDHSVGKSALAYRLIHGCFKTQASTHGQQFWVFPALGTKRADGTDCEAILWDFAGQPDYRIVHALFVDNADLALVLFDASDLREPLHGVNFWLSQLQAGQSHSRIVLVAAQTDRGACPLTPEELKAFCQKNGIVGPLTTSAFSGVGIPELVECMKSLILWEAKPATVTTRTFKKIKDYVLGLKEQGGDAPKVVTLSELRARLEAIDAQWQFTDAEMVAAVGHVENYGYVKRLRTSEGEARVLLQPERLNNLASSLVLEARRNPKGLGSLEEIRLLAGGYNLPELEDLGDGDRDVLMDSTVLLFLEHNVCFRETDPLRMDPYLVFPELINLKKPPEHDSATDEGVAYTVSGATENVFASLVVLLGYTHSFTRTAQWHENARYEIGDGLLCGFRQEGERDGELDFVLRFEPRVGQPVRTLFQGLFESFLARRNLTVMRYEPVRCTNAKCGHLLDRSVTRQRLNDGKPFAFCNDCGEKLELPTMAEPIQLTRELDAEVESQRRVANQRTRFEQAVFRVRTFAAEQGIKPPESFISYAWGVTEHERWVENRLARDLQKAGIDVVLDRWHNSQVGASVARFVERIDKCDRIVMVGTPLYRRKYENKETNTGFIVAAEVDLINNRLLGTEIQKQSVLPEIGRASCRERV